MDSFSSISSSSSEKSKSEKYTGVRINQNFQEVLRSECQEPLSGLSMLDLNLLGERFYDMVSDGLIIIKMSELLLCMKSFAGHAKAVLCLLLFRIIHIFQIKVRRTHATFDLNKSAFCSNIFHNTFYELCRVKMDIFVILSSEVKISI